MSPQKRDETAPESAPDFDNNILRIKESWCGSSLSGELRGRRLNLLEEGEEELVSYVGDVLELKLNWVFDPESTAQHARLRFGYDAYGSGSPETHDLFVLSLFDDPEQGAAGEQLTKNLGLQIPAYGPMSYEGIYVKVAWSLTFEISEAVGFYEEKKVPIAVLARPVELSQAPKLKESAAKK